VKTLVAMVALLFGLTASAVAQAADPWKKVPSFPTSCFSDNSFDRSVIDAGQAMIADKDQQDALNRKLREQFDAMDMAEKARRMQDWMMKNPQAASAMLEAASGGNAVQTAEEVNAESERLDKELETLRKNFEVTVDRAVQPVDARINSLIQSKAQQLSVDAVFTTDADYAAYVALIAERNSAYEKACAPFFGPSGSIARWFGAFRSNVSSKRIALEESGDAAMKQQLAIMGSSTGGYQSTGRYDVVREYLRRLEHASRYRKHKAEPTVRLVK
jgi:hypothetical protein